MKSYSRAGNTLTGPMLCKWLMCIVFVGVVSAGCDARAEEQAQGSWKAPSRRAHLENDSLKASFQSGMLYRLEDRRTGKTLLSVDPAGLPGRQPIFGSTQFDLDACRVVQTVTKESIEAVFRSPDGTSLRLLWSIEPDGGDLVLQASAETVKPVEEFRILIPGCDITEHTLVWIHAYGVGHTANAPWNGIFLADPTRDGSPQGFPHPLVALFQGHDGGWFIEGREPRVGPANLMVKGTGDSAVLGMNRRFSFPSTEPTLFEVRIRTYQDQWEDAVDPYVDWLETGGGFVALDKLPEQQVWIANLKTQAYIGVGDYQGVEELAKRVNPEETFIGRQAEFRYYGFDIGYPDYRLTDDAKKWTRRVRELGFHVGMHFNSKSVSAMFPDLVERFRPGFAVVGKDEDGNEIYEYIYEGPNRMYRVSAGFKPWRDYLIEQMADAVEAGVDVIYLDESMSPNGKWIVDGVDGIQGILILMQEILERYPHVAIQTEQFNTLTAKYGKMALSQMPLGHPLSGYIFSRFVKVVPEGVMYSPTNVNMMDAFDSWGYMIPGADTAREESWMRIAEAFHRYGLVPDSRLPREQFREYTHHYSSGEIPIDSPTQGDGGRKLFGFRGSNGVTAYLEKHPTKRGLVVYEPGEKPKWVGTRHTGIRSYDGPGLPEYYGFREVISDWLIYDGDKLLGLDPNQTYWFDVDLRPSAQRFHINQVPDDFVGITDNEKRVMPQVAGHDDTFFQIRFIGHGQIGAYVPDGYDAYLNGQKLEVNSQTRMAYAKVNASLSKADRLTYHIELADDTATVEEEDGATGKPASLIAFKRLDTELIGPWIDWPLFGSRDSLKWITSNEDNGFKMSVGTVGRFVGKIPDAGSVRIQGSYRMSDIGNGTPGDGVVRINGVEVLRVPHGEKPFKEIPFDVDISRYAGQYVFFEFTPDASVRGFTADWNNPRIVVGQ